jgi:hypothetical protein
MSKQPTYSIAIIIPEMVNYKTGKPFYGKNGCTIYTSP